MNSKELSLLVGVYCKEFRIEHLKLNLTQFSDKTQLNIKNVNAFEYGRANNIKYLYYYYQLANDNQKELFSTNLFNLI